MPSGTSQASPTIGVSLLANNKVQVESDSSDDEGTSKGRKDIFCNLLILL